MLKKLWEKIKTWWTNSKIKPIWDKIGKAVRQFLRYAYAAQISYLVLSVLFYFLISKFFGLLLTAWGIVLLIAEFRQQKADKVEIDLQKELFEQSIVKISKPKVKAVTKPRTKTPTKPRTKKISNK